MYDDGYQGMTINGYIELLSPKVKIVQHPSKSETRTSWIGTTRRTSTRSIPRTQISSFIKILVNRSYNSFFDKSIEGVPHYNVETAKDFSSMAGSVDGKGVNTCLKYETVQIDLCV